MQQLWAKMENTWLAQVHFHNHAERLVHSSSYRILGIQAHSKAQSAEQKDVKHNCISSMHACMHACIGSMASCGPHAEAAKSYQQHHCNGGASLPSACSAGGLFVVIVSGAWPSRLTRVGQVCGAQAACRCFSSSKPSCTGRALRCTRTVSRAGSFQHMAAAFWATV